MKKLFSKGLTFLELLVAMTIVMIAVVSILACINFASKVSRHNLNKAMAMELIIEKLEQIKGTAYASIVSSSGSDSRFNLISVQNPVYNWSIAVTTGNYKTITVTASWSRLGAPFNETESATTIISQ